ncbi:MAG: sugar kinase [Chitinophagaceae bacterium]
MTAKQQSIVTFGEIMLRLDCPPGQRFQRNTIFNRYYGGAEANVSVVLSQLGETVKYITALPSNDIGQAAIDELRAFGVGTSLIHRSGERVGIYFTEHGNNIRASRVIYDRKNSSFASLQNGMIDWEKVFESNNYFFWSGISASLTQNAADVTKEALAIATAKGITIAADMNYRRTLWDYGKHPSEVMPDLLAKCSIITGDIDTIKVYFGIKEGKGSNEDKFHYCAAELKKKLPAMKIFTMSFRGTDEYNQPTYSGALMIDDAFFFSPVFSLPQVVDRIGSGDAFQGGLLYGIMNNIPGQEIINFAIACGALKHANEGDFAIFSKNEVDSFVKSGAVNRVIR